MLQPPLGTPHFTFRPERGMRMLLRSFWTTEHPYPSQQRYEGLAPEAHPSLESPAQCWIKKLWFRVYSGTPRLVMDVAREALLSRK